MELRNFVSEVLEMQGSAVEAVEPDGLEVLAPEPLRAVMGWPELVRLGFGAELPAGATAVGFEGDWLDRFGTLLGDRGRWAVGSRCHVAHTPSHPANQKCDEACATVAAICPVARKGRTSPLD